MAWLVIVSEPWRNTRGTAMECCRRAGEPSLPTRSSGATGSEADAADAIEGKDADGPLPGPSASGLVKTVVLARMALLGGGGGMGMETLKALSVPPLSVRVTLGACCAACRDVEIEIQLQLERGG